MSKILTMCSGCTTKLRVPDKYLGQEVTCPKCQGTFVVKDLEASAPPAASVRPVTKPPTKPAPQPAARQSPSPIPPTIPAKKAAPSLSSQPRKPALAKNDVDKMFDEDDYGDLDDKSPSSKSRSLPSKNKSNSASLYEVVEDDFEDLDEDDYTSKPRGLPPKIKKKKSKAAALYDDDDRPRRRSSSGGVNGGLMLKGALMSIGAVVWFVVGLMGDRIFFYPPILLVIGIGTCIKGLMGSDE